MHARLGPSTPATVYICHYWVFWAGSAQTSPRQGRLWSHVWGLHQRPFAVLSLGWGHGRLWDGWPLNLFHSMKTVVTAVYPFFLPSTGVCQAHSPPPHTHTNSLFGLLCNYIHISPCGWFCFEDLNIEACTETLAKQTSSTLIAHQVCPRIRSVTKQGTVDCLNAKHNHHQRDESRQPAALFLQCLRSQLSYRRRDNRACV